MSLNIKTSFLQHLPMSYTRYREMLPLMPSAIRSLELRDYDFILSSSHCVAKGVLGGPNTFHLCYCYTPMRYAWSAYKEYFGEYFFDFDFFDFENMKSRIFRTKILKIGEISITNRTLGDAEIVFQNLILTSHKVK